MATERTFRIYRGDNAGGEMVDYATEVDEGMVVLDVVHRIQAAQAPDLAVRWNCKAGKCGSCSCEINGKPRLSCMTRMSTFPGSEPIEIRPIKTFPVIKDLVADVSWNFEQKKRIPPLMPRAPRADEDRGYRMAQHDVDRVQEFRKCIECFLCQDVCHVLRDHDRKDGFVGPRNMIHLAQLEMNPIDDLDRLALVRKEFGSGFCNITKCCTDVCPEHINLTDNAIIPLKERVVDRYYDPIAWLLGRLFGGRRKTHKATAPAS